ncbi:MAG: M23 family metallopeptidase [Blastocatellales bacterium]|nr:M23 family metallopeptidase [Blastocatellales bacterium]
MKSPIFSAFRVFISAFSAFSVIFCSICAPVAAVQTRPRTVNEQNAEWRIETRPQTLVNGAPFLVRVTPGARLQSLGGKWMDRRVFFRFDESSGVWEGIAGAGLDRTPGEYELTLEGVTANGSRATYSRMIAIGKMQYPEIMLRVARRFTQPDAATLRRIKREQELKSRIFSEISPERMWDAQFRPPIESVVTDGFGTQRVFNGQVQGVHQGLDYRAATGQAIAAMNAGRVILARNLFYEGNCVVIDHGQGLLTIYMHLSRMMVEEGARIERGAVLGLSGGTGRVTAPHLHVGVRWQGVYLNPKSLIELTPGGEETAR